MVDIIRLSQKAKDQLVWLKRQTGIKNWNVLCRWAFCLSLSDESSIANVDNTSDSNLEMTWKTFAGKYGEIYIALLEMWVHKSGATSQENMTDMVRKHIHRGTQRLMAEKDQSILGILAKVATPYT